MHRLLLLNFRLEKEKQFKTIKLRPYISEMTKALPYAGRRSDTLVWQGCQECAKEGEDEEESKKESKNRHPRMFQRFDFNGLTHSSTFTPCHYVLKFGSMFSVDKPPVTFGCRSELLFAAPGSSLARHRVPRSHTPHMSISPEKE